MINELTDIRTAFTEQHKNDHIESVELYPGIELQYITLGSDTFQCTMMN